MANFEAVERLVAFNEHLETNVLPADLDLERMYFPEDLPDSARPDLDLGSFEQRELIEKAFTQIPSIQKSVILLRDYEGYSYEEIADITGLNLSQVKVYIFRGRKKMQSAINGMQAFRQSQM